MLQGVTVGWDDSSIPIGGYFDGPISDEDRGLSSCVETEGIADSSESVQVRLECVRLDASAPPPVLNEGVSGRRGSAPRSRPD